MTYVRNLSTDDQKKLIECNYVTLISLLPVYLASSGNFKRDMCEKTSISQAAAGELERLMNRWGETRLFIGARSQLKTLTQTI
jgi:hypothetical protein